MRGSVSFRRVPRRRCSGWVQTSGVLEIKIIQTAAVTTQLAIQGARELFLYRLVDLAARPRRLAWTTGGFQLRVDLQERTSTWSVAAHEWRAEWIAMLPCHRPEMWREWPDHPAAPLHRLQHILAAGHALGDIIKIVWKAPGVIELVPAPRVRRLPNSNRAIEELGMRLVAAYPALLRCPTLLHELRPIPSTEATTEQRWYLRFDDGGAHLQTYHWAGVAAASSGLLHDAGELPAAARAIHTDVPIRAFAPIPSTSRIFYPYTRPFPHNRASVRRLVLGTKTIDGVAALRARLFQWDVQDDCAISMALLGVPWPYGPRGFPALLPHELHTWLRLRHHDFRCWRVDGATGCVHNCGMTFRETPRHVFWDCATAQALWMSVISCWSHDPGTSRDWLGEIFGGTLRELRFDAWPIVCDHVLRRLPRADAATLDAAATHIYPVLNQLWRLHVTLAFQALWAWRLRKIRDGCKLGHVFLAAQVQAAFTRRSQIHLAVEALAEPGPPATARSSSGLRRDTRHEWYGLRRATCPTRPRPTNKRSYKGWRLVSFNFETLERRRRL